MGGFAKRFFAMNWAAIGRIRTILRRSKAGLLGHILAKSRPRGAPPTPPKNPKLEVTKPFLVIPSLVSSRQSARPGRASIWNRPGIGATVWRNCCKSDRRKAIRHRALVGTHGSQCPAARPRQPMAVHRICGVAGGSQECGGTYLAGPHAGDGACRGAAARGYAHAFRWDNASCAAALAPSGAPMRHS